MTQPLATGDAPMPTPASTAGAPRMRNLDGVAQAATIFFAATMSGVSVLHLSTLVRLPYPTPPGGLAMVAIEAALAGMLLSAAWLARTKPSKAKRKTVVVDMVLTVLASISMTTVVGAGFTEFFTDLSQGHWARERERFASAPDGFQTFRALAHTQFGLELELGRVEDSWLGTTHTGPGSSVAQMSVEAGYCLLSLSPRGVARKVTPPANVPDGEAMALRFVVAHELGHCVDISRDNASFQNPREVGRRSVAPPDASSVKDVHTLYLAGQKPTTAQWREVFADLFALGYARLTWPAHWQALTDPFVEARRSNAEVDHTHATACWLQAAAAEPDPASLSDIPAWADRIRTTAPCTVQQDAPPRG